MPFPRHAIWRRGSLIILTKQFASKKIKTHWGGFRRICGLDKGACFLPANMSYTKTTILQTIGSDRPNKEYGHTPAAQTGSCNESKERQKAECLFVQ